jgi:ADP-ribose pyrophosphatase YjhB (NUDIX family)
MPPITSAYHPHTRHSRQREAIGYDAPVTFVDRLYQIAYKIGYQLIRILWAILRPTTHGALIVVWRSGSVLLVRNSYLPYYSLPGGYVRGGETTLQAAIRELKEETGLDVEPSELKLSHEETHDWEFRRDHVTMYDLMAQDAVGVNIDHREVISAQFYTPEEALKLRLFPPLRRRIEKYLAEHAAVKV